MNMNHGLVSRALAKAGDEKMTDDEWSEKENSARYRMVHDFYLQTILEALSQVDWTRGKKRSKLSEATATVYSNDGGSNYYSDEACRPWQVVDVSDFVLTAAGTVDGAAAYTYTPTNYTDYSYCYSVPYDCARIIGLQKGAEWITEGGRIYTDQKDAVLLYIGNGHLSSKDVAAKASAVSAGTASAEDYPEYGDIDMEDIFWQYIEIYLASKIAFKLTAMSNIYTTLYAEAEKKKQDAISASRASGFSREPGDVFWTEGMGGDI